MLFAVITVGGLFLGDASRVVDGVAQGNLGGVTLHMTYARDAVDGILLLLLIYVGFFSTRTIGRVLMLCVGVFVLGIGIAGFVHGDNTLASKPLLGLNFPTAINVLDTVVGALAVLAGLGTLSDGEIEAPENRSFLREG